MVIEEYYHTKTDATQSPLLVLGVSYAGYKRERLVSGLSKAE
jgi:hypothetical protein